MITPTIFRPLIPGLALVLSATLSVSPTFAQSDPVTPTTEEVSETTTDDKPVLLQADRATYDAASGIYTAEGHVEASYDDRTLLADKVTYDINANEIRATGDVTIIDKSGTVLQATDVRLDGALETGLIETFGLLIGENARLAGTSAQRSKKTTEINRAIYSPCKVCKDTRGGLPVWQIRALKVTHDRGKRIISYRHAYLEVLGVPVLYTPWFWHPDPSVARKSGFLVPGAGNSTDLGNFFEIPYYWAIAPNIDATLTPLFITHEASVLKGEFRMRTRTGEFQFDGSITNPDRLDGDGNPLVGNQIRDHLFGEGRFSAGPLWDWGFDIELSSDDTYLKRYNIHDSDELRNRFFLQTRSDRNYAVIDSYYFVGLRSTDDPGQTPVILPNVHFQYHLEDPVLNGHMFIEGGFLSLQRTEGADMERLSVAATWKRPWISTGGQVVNMFGNLRGDLYHMNDLQHAPVPLSTKDTETRTRVLPTIGVEWSFPLARPSGRGYQVIEPIVQLVASPSGLNPDEISNEDSLSFEFDDTNLFKANKFPGLDRWEEGLRLNVGIKAALVGRGAGENSVTLGQTFRQEKSDLFDSSTGLDTKRSDYVGKLVLTPLKQLRMIHRFRLDKEDFSFRRNEVDIWVGTKNYWLEAGYLTLGSELSESGLEAREELNAKIHLKIRGNWSFEADGIRNLETDDMIRARASLVYRDECTDFEITAKRRFTEDRDIEPTTSIFFRVKLKSLG